MGQLGDTLRERRTAQGLSLMQAEEATRIRSKLLESLENGDYDRLPDPGYVRGYVTSYAAFLELDSTSLLAMYRSETGAGGRSRDIAPAGEAVKPRGQQHAVPLNAALVIVVILAVLAAGVWLIVRAVQGPETPPPIPTAGSQVPTSTTLPADSSAIPKADQTAAAPAVSETQPFALKVSIAADGASWLRVTVDGKKAYEGSLTGGQSKEFQVTKTAVVKVGKPSFVTVYRDGKQVAIPAGGGTPTVTLKAEPTQ